ncbi:hypothetical protein [Ichthyenterobacterium magnum]|uniref:Methyltransferase family protein n=1 Tax=Ichthyenterobacterium magnum TaxID=1230530 RepID=A0A420DVW2_9FLAO|nr:hypothetical protein [Ichthyenterobacterium magnum]RKE98352.1 hypothetical protein BXY80_0435 [Ichthyenterobacterium magnum]
MKRVQLFEFEDFSWFPTWVRSSMTNLITVLHKMIGTKEVLVDLLTKINTKHPFSQVVDMGSGSGGIMPDVIQQLNKTNSESISLLLTDLYPNKQFINYINQQHLENVTYSEHSLNATNLSKAPKGIKIMVNSFHHMPPNNARQILKSAQDNKEPILIYEMAENKMPLLLWWILLPISLTILFIMALFMTPFCKPLSLKQLIFTYLIPIIPIFYAWDGQASMPRMYAFGDVEELLKDFKNESYSWEFKSATKPNGKNLGYYILGLPNKALSK